jgi:hypothetical protein
MQVKNIFNRMMDCNQSSLDRWSLVLGHILMLVLVFFSIRYYQERLLLIDSSFYTFKILQEESFFIAHHRYINYFNQWLPLLLIKLGVGLKGVMIGYSMSFVLFYYAIFAIVAYLFKNPKVALFMVVTLLLTGRFKHYMAVTETTSTLALSFLFVGWVTRERYLVAMHEWREWLVAFGFILILLVGHPIVFLPLMSFGIFYIAFYGLIKNPYAWLTFGLIVLGFILRYLLIPSVGYETDKLDAFGKSYEIITNIFQQNTYQSMKAYVMANFKWGYYLYLASLISLVYLRKYLAAVLSLATLICYLCVIVIVYYEGESINMLESYYLYIGYFWGFTIMSVYAYLKVPTWIKILPLVFVVFMGVRGLLKYGSFFTDRLEYMHTLSDEGVNLGQPKVLYPRSKVESYKVLVSWSVPYTTAIYSSLQDAEDTRTVFMYTDSKLESLRKQNGNNTFFGAPFDLREYNVDDLSTKYFNLKECDYHIIEYNQESPE